MGRTTEDGSQETTVRALLSLYCCWWCPPNPFIHSIRPSHQSKSGWLPAENRRHHRQHRRSAVRDLSNAHCLSGGAHSHRLKHSPLLTPFIVQQQPAATGSNSKMRASGINTGGKSSSIYYMKTCYHRRMIISFFPFLALLIISISNFLLPQVQACPFPVQQFCLCVDQLDGVLLNCSTAGTTSVTLTSTEATTAMTPTILTTVIRPASMAVAAQEDIERRQAKIMASMDNQNDNGEAANRMMQTLKDSQAHLGLIKLLHIHDTAIPVLPDHFFNGLYIKRLELLNCAISSVEKGAFKGLEGVLQELTITGNNLEEMPSEALQQMNSLYRLDLSNNSIGELKAEHSLNRVPKLNDINLSHNRITAVHKTFFDNVKNSLQTVNLGHNQLEEVPASALRGFRKLVALHLHNNKLQALPQLSFMNLPVLSLLNLASNQMQSIHRQAFLNAPQLRFLYLSSNKLTEVHPFQFSSFERLEMLDLSNNLLEALGNDTLAGLPSLRQLYLGENRISEIKPHAFSANSSLAVLILEQNRLTELEKDSGFLNLRHLQQLSLKHNKLRSIDAGAFQGNPGLVMLDLSHNELIDLAPATFLSQLNLLLVDLSHNRIVRTPFGAFGRRVATVLLQENPLVCVEKIHMLQQGNGIFIPNNEDAICGPKGETSVPNNPNIPGQSTVTVQQQQQPSSAMEKNDEAADDEEGKEGELLPDDNPSAFVQHLDEEQQQQQQQQQLPVPIPSGVNNGRLATNIKPIRRISATHHEQQRGKGSTPPTDSFESSSEPIALTERLLAEEAGETGRPTSTEEFSPESPTTESPEARFNPNVIYPHPVPFLQPAPKMHIAKHVKNDENGNPILVPEATLPPSIVIADGSHQQQATMESGPSQISSFDIEHDGRQQEEGGGGNSNNNEIHHHGSEDEPSSVHQQQHQQEHNRIMINASSSSPSTDYGKFEEFQLHSATNNVVVKEAPSSERIEKGNDGQEELAVATNNEELANVERGTSKMPTAVIVVCMGTVAAVMCAVFVGLCVARKRQLSQMCGSEAGIRLTTTGFSNYHHQQPPSSAQHSPNSNSFMSAAVAARAAKMNNNGNNGNGYFYASNTLQRGQRSASGTINNNNCRLASAPASQDADIYGWLYTHHHNPAAGFNAYKK